MLSFHWTTYGLLHRRLGLHSHPYSRNTHAHIYMHLLKPIAPKHHLDKMILPITCQHCNIMWSGLPNLLNEEGGLSVNRLLSDTFTHQYQNLISFNWISAQLMIDLASHRVFFVNKMAHYLL